MPVAVCEPLSEDPELLPWHDCQSNRPLGKTIIIVLGGDLSIDMLSDQRNWNNTIVAKCDVE